VIIRQKIYTSLTLYNLIAVFCGNKQSTSLCICRKVAVCR
jgi:hypothetical protein